MSHEAKALGRKMLSGLRACRSTQRFRGIIRHNATGLILQNRPLRLYNFAPSGPVSVSTNSQYFVKIFLTRIATSAELRSVRRSIE